MLVLEKSALCFEHLRALWTTAHLAAEHRAGEGSSVNALVACESRLGSKGLEVPLTVEIRADQPMLGCFVSLEALPAGKTSAAGLSGDGSHGALIAII